MKIREKFAIILEHPILFMDEFTVLLAALMACIVVFGLGCISIYLGHQRKLEADKNARIIAVEEEKTNRARVAAGREYVNAQLEAGVFNSQNPQDEGGLGNLMQYLPMILPLLQQKQGQVSAQQGATASAVSFPGGNAGGDTGSSGS
ncbi:MAG TPA: hypothetical protein O0Y06_03890 [Methanocorpusculum sp.]|nr:hypothetical protein [Methanocorpusculum sp.]HJK80025.1 hypothetical protein [Methanocorpusculum sp.]